MDKNKNKIKENSPVVYILLGILVLLLIVFYFFKKNSQDLAALPVEQNSKLSTSTNNQILPSQIVNSNSEKTLEEAKSLDLKNKMVECPDEILVNNFTDLLEKYKNDKRENAWDWSLGTIYLQGGEYAMHFTIVGNEISVGEVSVFKVDPVDGAPILEKELTEKFRYFAGIKVSKVLETFEKGYKDYSLDDYRFALNYIDFKSGREVQVSWENKLKKLSCEAFE